MTRRLGRWQRLLLHQLRSMARVELASLNPEQRRIFDGLVRRGLVVEDGEVYRPYIEPQTEQSCPDCGVSPGNEHWTICDVAVCVVCGEQNLSCMHGPHGPEGYRDDLVMQVWAGEHEG